MKTLLKVCCLTPSSLMSSSGVNSRSHCLALREVPPCMPNCSSRYFLFLCRGTVREKLALCNTGLRGRKWKQRGSFFYFGLWIFFCLPSALPFAAAFSAAFNTLAATFAAFSAAFSLAFSLCRLRSSTCSAFSRFSLSFSSISAK